MTDMTRSLLKTLVPFAQNISVSQITRDLCVPSGMVQSVVVGRRVTFELVVPNLEWSKVSEALLQLPAYRDVHHRSGVTERWRTIAEVELTGDTANLFCELAMNAPSQGPVIIGIDPSGSYVSTQAREERQREYEQAALF